MRDNSELKKQKNKRSPVAALCSALGTLILVGLIVLCLPLTVPRLMGYELYTVVSGSMEPEIPIGSLVCVRENLPEEAKAGDVIAFYGARDSAAIITHRVVENRVVMGEIITKGDANQTNDMNPMDYDNYIGKVEKSIPKLGMAAQMLTSSDGKTAASCVIGLALVLYVISMILDKEKKSQK